jgi:hypothetical protein
VRTLSTLFERVRKRRGARFVPLLTLTLWRDRYGSSPESLVLRLSDRTLNDYAGYDWLPAVIQWGGPLGSELGFQAPSVNPLGGTLRVSLRQRVGGVDSLLHLMRYGSNSAGYEVINADVLVQLGALSGGSPDIVTLGRARLTKLSATQEDATFQITGLEQALDPEDGASTEIVGSGPAFYNFLIKDDSPTSHNPGGPSDPESLELVEQVGFSRIEHHWRTDVQSTERQTWWIFHRNLGDHPGSTVTLALKHFFGSLHVAFRVAAREVLGMDSSSVASLQLVTWDTRPTVGAIISEILGPVAQYGPGDPDVPDIEADLVVELAGRQDFVLSIEPIALPYPTAYYPWFAPVGSPAEGPDSLVRVDSRDFTIAFV